METRDNNNWKDTVKKAEVAPSEGVWKGIEFQLDKQEVVQLRGQVQYYKRLATAACVTIALLAVGGAYTWFSSTETSLSNEPVVASNTISEPDKSAKQNLGEKATESVDVSSSSAASAVSSRPSAAQAKYVKVIRNNHVNTSEGMASHASIGDNRDETQEIISDQQPFTQLSSVVAQEHGNTQSADKAINSQSIGKEETPVSPLLKEPSEKVSLFATAKEEDDDNSNKKGEERFWTAVGFSAGTFNNVTPSSANTPASVLRSSAGGQTAASESNSPGQTYSVNVSVGTKVAKRWIVQGGMSYISQSSDYTANSVVATDAPAKPTFTVASINEFEKQASDENTKNAILASTPYTVNNTLQIISIPVQAGFLVFERKLALQINSGVSTDLFMQNTLTPSAENLEKTTRGRGDDSPYRPVNFSGLVGTELSYKVGDNYRVSLSPGLRYPFNSIYKTDLGLRSSPLTFDVAVRFRYIFH